MEIIVTIEAVGAYTERDINRTDGTTDCFKSRGLMLAHGAEKFYGELTGYSAVKYKETEFFEKRLYAVRDYWSHNLVGENKNIHQNKLTITSIEPMIGDV